MNLIDGVKAVIRKVKDKRESKKEIDKQNEAITKWKKKYERAKSQWDLTRFDEREYLYLGTKSVDKNINSGQTPTKKANNIFNIIYELVESQINTTIPQPSVRSKRENFDLQSAMIEDSLSNDIKELGIEEINDRNERVTPVQGFSIITIDWNPDYKHHLYKGELQLDSKHPKQLVPQPQVRDIQKMDYYFTVSDVTQEYVKRRYGIDMDGEKESDAEHTSLGVTDSIGTTFEDEKLSEICCMYKDEDGDIGKFVWCNDTVLEDLPKYFYRRVEKCTQCEAPRMRDEEDDYMDVCPQCGGTKFKKATEKEETLLEDIAITNYKGEQVVLPAGTKVPYFIPTHYPIVIQTNVPKPFSLEGQSDVDIIRDQQDSIKKVVTKMEEKIIKGGTVLKVADDHNVAITDQIYQVIKGTASQLSVMGTMDLTADISRDIQFVQEQYQVAKSMLGITDSFQGKTDPTAQSGKAKQIQVQQASGRLLSKQFNKNTAYKNLYLIMFEHKLALYDELRPYLSQDDQGKDVFQNFDKYAFLVQDAAGKVYYNTDFIFSADGGDGLPKDKMFMLDNANAQLQSGAINQMQYWMILESINYPKAAQIRKQIEEQMQQQAQMEQQQAEADAQPDIDKMIKQLPPEQQQAFMALSPEEQQSYIDQVLGGVA